jgi:hypothetical protein
VVLFVPVAASYRQPGIVVVTMMLRCNKQRLLRPISVHTLNTVNNNPAGAYEWLMY